MNIEYTEDYLIMIEPTSNMDIPSYLINGRDLSFCNSISDARKFTPEEAFYLVKTIQTDHRLIVVRYTRSVERVKMDIVDWE